MESSEFDAISTWYQEWVQLPKYVTTASLAFLAFSLTNLLPKSPGPPPATLRIAWVALGSASVLGGSGILPGGDAETVRSNQPPTSIYLDGQSLRPVSAILAISHLPSV